MEFKNNKQMMDAIRGRIGEFTPKVVDEFPDPDFEGMKKADLLKYADDLGLDVSQKATKSEIITAIKEAE